MGRRRRRDDDARISGFVLVDKPLGWTSHDVVGWLRPRLGVRRVGHSGTLDPLASGLLPCLVGPATRLVQFLSLFPKTYVGVIALGLESPTGDAEGIDSEELEQREKTPMPPSRVIEAARTKLSGPILQEPPAFSAKKIRGTPAHRLARAGANPALPPVQVTIHRLRLAPARGARLAFAARVSSGTYLRSLARDLGRLLGTGAYLESLRRTAVGPLRVRGALRPGPEQPPEGLPLSPVEELPLPMGTRRLDDAESRDFSHGRALRSLPPTTPGPTRCLDAGGRLLGVGELSAEGALRPRVVLLSPAAGAPAPEQP